MLSTKVTAFLDDSRITEHASQRRQYLDHESVKRCHIPGYM